MNQKEYQSDFGIDAEKADKAKAQKALEQALVARKFEIALYWRRAAYFGALIAGAFIGYFAVLNSTALLDRYFLASAVGCFGLLFTWAWFLINRGSKYWQESWESHIDLLEDEVMGPLYKTRFRRPPTDDVYERYVTGSLSISVTKVLQWVNAFVLCVWLILLCHAWWDWRCCAIDLLTVAFGFAMLFKARTSTGARSYVAEKGMATFGTAEEGKSAEKR